MTIDAIPLSLNCGPDGVGYLPVAPPEGVRAFPGAEGISALTRGAASYTGTKSVAIVSNLNDSGAGSLREAIAGAGKDGSFVVFTVSGIINLLTMIDVLSSDITIAAQTSPGGVCTAGNNIRIGNTDNPGMSNIIIRHLRFRPGSHGGAADTDQEAMRLSQCNNVMIDHCSFSWGGDETVSPTTYDSTSVYNITFSHCIITHGLTDVAPESNHGYGMLFNGTYSNTPENSMDIHNSYFAHHNSRMPQISGAGKFSLVNNIVYDFDSANGIGVYVYKSQETEMKVNFISNYVKAGVNSNGYIGDGSGGNMSEIQLRTGSGYTGAVSSCPDTASNVTVWEAIYTSNNYGQYRQSDVDQEWCCGCGYSGNLASTDWQSASPFAVTEGVAITPVSLTAATAEAQATTILADVGATMPSRDSYDTTVVDDFINDTGTLQGDVTYPTDWPTYATPSAPTDSNSDGIPDTFDTANGFTTNGGDDIDPFATAPSGYLWIEEYINGMA